MAEIGVLRPNPTQNQKTEVADTSNSQWSAKASSEIYGIEQWGRGYFRINSKGHVCVTPSGHHGPEVNLKELIEDLKERGIRTPILVRFPDIVKARIQLLYNCFSKAIKEYDYTGKYQGVYPIKVNQQRHLIEEIVRFGQVCNLGLECGSKPELLVGLAMLSTPEALIIVNGFKDTEYIETAILSQKLGRNTVIVVDRISELPMVLAAAQKFNSKPKIGFRSKLDSKGAGKWIDSSGARSKFGLTPSELVAGVELLKKQNMLDCLELLHFHIGSQISSIQAIKTSLKEGTRFFAELYKMGAPLKYIDVGGGLAIDYDGTGNSDYSTNYDEQEYANDVVSTIQSVCDEKSIPHPTIITESGRSIVAHHSVLVFDVLGTNEVLKEVRPASPAKQDHKTIQDLYEIYEKLAPLNINESYNDTLQLKNDVLQLFSYGFLSLADRSKAEDLIWAIITKMAKIAQSNEDAEDLVQELDKELSDTYFGNFSLFQSVPDSWAVNQLFPVIPITRLNEKPARRGVIVDLTCDSDGKIDRFIGNGEITHTLPVHSLEENKPYYLGVFLLGAYQEILGDLHNLFGDTDAVHITISETGYTVEHVVEGDTVSDVLSYVQYQRAELIHNVRRATEIGIRNGSLTKQEARLLMKHYEDGLSGYTYLEDL